MFNFILEKVRTFLTMGFSNTPNEKAFEKHQMISPVIHVSYLETFLRETRKKIDLVRKFMPYMVTDTLSVDAFQLNQDAVAHKAWKISGKVLNVCYYLVKVNLTFGIHHAVVSGNDRRNMLFMPEGFTYGFSALEDAIFNYKCSKTYHEVSGEGINPNDPGFIGQGVDSPYPSVKDRALSTLNKFVQDSEGGL